MVIEIDRECEHKIIAKHGMFLIVTLHEIINNVDDIDKMFKVSVTNVSLINDYSGSQISKIGGSGYTNTEAYSEFITAFNKNRSFHAEENKILLCCDEIPEISLEDLKEFKLTRRIRFTWEKDNKYLNFYAYIRKEEDKFLFTYDGTEETYTAKSDREIVEYILKNCSFDKEPVKTSIRRRGRLFYPTLENFLR